jgi:transposase
VLRWVRRELQTSAMNQLNVSLQHSIVTLSAQGWSARKVARELGLNRETVGRYLRLAADAAKPAIPPIGSPDSKDPKPAISPHGSEAAVGPKPAILPVGSKSGRTSQCTPLQEVIQRGLEAGLSAQRIYQDLVTEHRFTGSYDSVKRFVRSLEQATEIPFRRMECAPGHELQVDFGQGAWILVEGKRRRSHLFRGVLGHSRKGYTEATPRQSTEHFIRYLENAFRSFGGVPATVVIDNLKAGVIDPDLYDPRLNPKLEELAQHYGTVILPTRPAMPRHKAKIEAGVEYAQNNAIKGRSFGSLAEQNEHLLQWERTVADTRIHGTIRQQVGKLFETVEKPLLRPLPSGLFPVFEEARRCVHRDAILAKPWHLCGEVPRVTLTLKLQDELIDLGLVASAATSDVMHPQQSSGSNRIWNHGVHRTLTPQQLSKRILRCHRRSSSCGRQAPRFPLEIARNPFAFPPSGSPPTSAITIEPPLWLIRSPGTYRQQQRLAIASELLESTIEMAR